MKLLLCTLCISLFASASAFARSQKVINTGDDYDTSGSVADYGSGSSPKYSGPLKVPAGVYALYQDPRAGNGICMTNPTEAPNTILRRNGITTQGNPDQKELAALAKGIAQVERLLGKPLPQSWRTPYHFINASGGPWRQTAGGIHVRRAGPGKGAITGRLMHELGHKVGNSGVYSAYSAFTRGENCKISPYATKKRNECFAEVFEAYVTFPDLLMKQCPQSFKFFAEKLFPGSVPKTASCLRAGSGMSSRLSSTGGRNRNSVEGEETSGSSRPAVKKSRGGTN